ncbi:MAG TPA: L,D-transpeptidase [Bacillales bacterium]|nr:L,D-transpeptidase [Bacillales bacterium]
MKAFMAVLIVFNSPLWPIGENPIPGDPYIIINKKTNLLAYIDDNEIRNVYPVGTGKSEELTPEGEFTITVKAKNPYYRKRDIPGGSERNPLGSRWIGFDAKGTNGREYGMHGNSNPASIGHYVSAGCVRMYEKDVQELYNYVPLGTKVLIVSTDRTFEQLAIEHGALTKVTKAPQTTS